MLGKVQIYMETMIMAALAFVISFIPLQTVNFEITLGIVPILFIGLKRGVKPSMVAGFIWGILNILSGKAFILNPLQCAVEEIIAFTSSGLCGLWRQRLKDGVLPVNRTIIEATAAGVGIRYFFHFIAGGLFWKAFIPKQFNPWLFSLFANGTSAVATTMVASYLLIMLYQNQKIQSW